MATEALIVNLGKAIQNDPFIMGSFTDHEILCINGMIKLWITFFWKIICSLGMLLGFVLRCFSGVHVLESTCLFHSLAIY